MTQVFVALYNYFNDTAHMHIRVYVNIWATHMQIIVKSVSLGVASVIYK